MGGFGTAGGDEDGRGQASRFVEREGRPQFDSRSYNVSFRSALIVVLLFVAILVGVYLIFT